MVVDFYDACDEQLSDYGARRHDCHLSTGYAFWTEEPADFVNEHPRPTRRKP